MYILPSISWIFLYSISNLRGEYEEGCDFLQITSLTRLMRLTSDILFKHSIKSKSKKSPCKSGIRSCRVNHISFTIIAVWVAMNLIFFFQSGPTNGRETIRTTIYSRVSRGGRAGRPCAWAFFSDACKTDAFL